MGEAKQIVLRSISASEANALVRRVHYSGKTVNNSQVHIGIFYNGNLEGAMQFGPSLDKRKIQGLVEGTKWHEFIELNRMAFTDKLPRNSESRAIGIAIKMLKKHAPQIKWIISFADATQCGDGAIYRASGFVLTGIKVNNQIWIAPEGHARESRMSLTDPSSERQKQIARSICRVSATKGRNITHSASLRPGIGSIKTAASPGGGSSMKEYVAAGFKPLEGFQLRYIYFIDPDYKQRLTVPILPFSEIDRQGAGMYKGQKRVESADSGTADFQSAGGGVIPTSTLHIKNDG